MSKLLIDHLNEAFPDHEISSTINEDGYSDVELLIDGYWTAIWVDDYMLYRPENHEDFQDDYEYIKGEIANYLTQSQK